MFKKRSTNQPAVTVTLDRREVSLPGDASVAAGAAGTGGDPFQNFSRFRGAPFPPLPHGRLLRMYDGN